MTTEHARTTFLQLLGARNSPQTRLAALRILLRRFDTRELWTQAEPDVIDLAHQLDDHTLFTRDALSTLACVPLRSVREWLQQLADRSSGDELERVLRVLSPDTSAADTGSVTALVERSRER